MNALVRGAMPHLIVVPILLPMLVAAAMLAMGEGRLRLKAALSMCSAVLGLAVSCVLLAWSDRYDVVAYLPGNWPARKRARRHVRRRVARLGDARARGLDAHGIRIFWGQARLGPPASAPPKVCPSSRCSASRVH